MKDNRRRWLRESIRKHLIPAFEELGFVLVPLSGEEAASRELQASFPFGHLRRISTRGIDLVEFQLDKRDAAFRLNIGVAPFAGVDSPLAGHIAQEDVRVHYLSRYFVAYDRPLFRRWFAVRRGLFRRPATRADYENLVAEHLGLVREVEDVLIEGKQGPHIRVVEI